MTRQRPNEPPYAEVVVPGRPLMFSRYQFSAELLSCDAFDSLAKMKSAIGSHSQLCARNVFFVLRAITRL